MSLKPYIPKGLKIKHSCQICGKQIYHINPFKVTLEEEGIFTYKKALRKKDAGYTVDKAWCNNCFDGRRTF